MTQNNTYQLAYEIDGITIYRYDEHALNELWRELVTTHYELGDSTTGQPRASEEPTGDSLTPLEGCLD